MMKNREVTAYIGMGSNLDNPKEQLRLALEHLDAIRDWRITGCSHLYTSKPWGKTDQPDFYNMVVALATSLSPEALLNRLQDIEKKQNRKRDIHWGPRTLDLDILLYGDLCMQEERLTIPHVQMHLRNFVLFPLADIEDSLTLPCGNTLLELCEKIGRKGIAVDDDPEFELLVNRLCRQQEG